MNQINTQQLFVRKSQEMLLKDYELVKSNSLAVSILNAIPIATMLLNQQNQLIYGNQALLDLLEITDVKPYLGFKPGELLGCTNSRYRPEGCGSSPACKVCGTLKAINECINFGSGNGECTINSSIGPLNLSVSSKSIEFDNQEFILFSFQDISNEKKRVLLERIFYHDILNTAHNISGMTELLTSEEFEDSHEQFLGMLMKSSTKLIDEINTHRLITYDNQLDHVSNPVDINSIELFYEMTIDFKSFIVRNDAFILDNRSEDFTFTANKVLIKRVVTNMIKNAFEAEKEDGQVTFGIIPYQQKGAMIWVHNPSFMNDDIQLQIFNRSFSTKAADRGLGTYSMKILTEKYLKGKIYFTSKPETGTSFIIEIPGQG